jgi:hypothetical protein
MPLVRFDLIQGRTPQEISRLLDAAHRALVAAFAIPERDRYQTVSQLRSATVSFPAEFSKL